MPPFHLLASVFFWFGTRSIRQTLAKDKPSTSLQQRNATDLFPEINTPFIDHLEQTLPAEGMAKLAQSCSFFNKSFEKLLEIKRIEKLKNLINWGREEKAKAMLTRYPKLLLEKKGRASDVFSRPGMEKTNLTPLQIALCNGDVEMAKIIRVVFYVRFENTGELIQKQFKEIFLNGIDTLVEEQKANAFKFDDIAEAIAKNNEQALIKMREDLVTQTSNELIANPQHLLNAFRTYRAKFNEFTEKQRDLYCIKVIGFVQSRLPACYLQAFVQPLINIVENGESLERSFKYSETDIAATLEAFGSGSGLGFDYWDSLWESAVNRSCSKTTAETCVNILADFISNKNNALKQLLRIEPSMRTKPSNNHCLIL